MRPSLTHHPAIRARLYRDNSGAIMIMGVFMAVFLVSVLYYLVGVGETIMHRQRLQDAADSAAFSAAAMHARGMNIIVLINMIMAALLSILVALKVVEIVCIAGVVIATGLAFPTFGSSLSAIPPLKSMQQTVHTVFEELKPPIFAALEGLHMAASNDGFGVKRVIPLASQARVLTKLSSEYSPDVTEMVTFPIIETLPVADDSFDRLCEKAGQYAVKTATLPLGPLAKIPIFDIVSNLVGKLSKNFSGWFCGGSGQAPTLDYEVSTSYPPAVEREQCSRSQVPASADGLLAESNSACDEAKRQESFATPNVETGECVADSAHEVDATRCDSRKKDARKACAPPAPATGGAGKNFTQYRWQQRQVTVIYHRGPAAKPIEERHDGLSVRREEKNPPACYVASASSKAKSRAVERQGAYDMAQQGLFASELDKWSEWNATADGPVCYEKHPVPPEVEYGVPVEYTEIVDVIGCVEQRQNHETVKEEDRLVSDEKQGSDKSPQKLEDGLAMGDERFQIRSLAYSKNGAATGANSVTESERLIKLSTWGKDGSRTSVLDAGKELGHFSAAQAEYFYNGTEDHAEQMWNMKWKARFRRFRFSSNDGSTNTSGMSPDLSGAFKGLIGEINELILH